MNNSFKPLFILVLALAALLYFGGIMWAGIASLNTTEKPDIPEFVKACVTSIGGILSTYFGALFGIARKDESAKSVRKTGLLRFSQWATIPDNSKATITFKAPQIAIIYLYFVSLLLAVFFWALDSFSNKSAETISNMSFSLLGVIVGFLTVTLITKK